MFLIPTTLAGADKAFDDAVNAYLVAYDLGLPKAALDALRAHWGRCGELRVALMEGGAA